ncbi:lysin A [Gordonia phage Ali17]|uniref:Lysin A n=1 Tax=Gordonia phage Ali17 TaxID=2301561 RepID=A0A385DN10_9CAUD|nr:endolysin [Gordonia phage Ali17]AXQ60654.1 lysin A [Gordonia phage Ali17]
MSFAPRTLDYARRVAAIGTAMGITPRGIKIAFTTMIVETGINDPAGRLLLRNLANSKVPESLKIPNDGVGSDGYSVGVFQQQVRRGNGNAWWWGDAATCMNIEASARLFFERLARIDYEFAGRSPGKFAQDVQGSAFPDRYDQRFAEAVALYDTITDDTPEAPTVAPDYGITHRIHGYNPNSAGIGNSNGPRSSTRNGAVHTQQGGTGDAIALAKYCNGAQVGYNICVDDQFTVENVPVGEGSWSAADANNVAFHLCFAGSFAEWSRGRWLSADASDGLNEDAMMWRGAKAMAAACQQFGFPAKAVGSLRYADNNWPPEPGICGHVSFGRRGGGHTDPGVNFPMDEFVRRVLTFMRPAAAAPNLIDAEARVAASWIGKRLDPSGAAGENVIAPKGTKLGAFVRYENAHVYWRLGANAAYAIPHGGLFEAYKARGFEGGALGFPVMRHEVVTAGGVTGGVQAFQGGTLMTPVGGPVEGYRMHGLIGKAYAAQDWEQGPLGWPKSDEYPFPAMGEGCIRQDFTGGSLVYTPTGVVIVAA